ncbi:hypothetical protein [Falsiroseomonas sp.]|uniref:hypothetical protein n=1 Tax=Falsiroseomonas sp. TaxID=2870721 RepID=UPI0027333260|nr:hypothetical protein [Falsiroseomonas sp.]MDP3417651.1 hypothetical protein [Falsiroseomonas sp.]
MTSFPFYRRFAIDHHLTPRQIRGSGLLLISLGLLLLGFAAMASAALLHVPFPEQWLPPGLALVKRPVLLSEGTVLMMAAAAFAFLAMILAAATCLQGVWQLAFGSRNVAVIDSLLVLGMLMLTGGVSASLLFARPISRLLG